MKRPPARGKFAYWSDESVPDLSAILTPGLGIDAAAFADWLGPRLGDYRVTLAAQRDVPPPADEVAYLEAAIAALGNAEAFLKPRSMPDRVDCDVFMVARRIGLDWPALHDRLVQDLGLVRGLLQAVPPPTESRPGKRGAPRKTHRDALVAAIEERLRASGLTADNARDLAHKILEACDADPPKDVKRAARRGRKLPAG